jgi:hypothetical protein
MNSETPQPAQDGRPAPVESSAEAESKHPGHADDTLSALNLLEEMLKERQGGPPTLPPAEPLIESDGQLNIPLLDEVLLPGFEDIERPFPDVPPVVLSPVAQRLFDRLASEIDVIVQTGVDEALKAAAKNIRARVKQHVSIVLPEILDELSHEDE